MAAPSIYLAAELYAEIIKGMPRKKRPIIAKLLVDTFSDMADIKDWSLEPGTLYTIAYPEEAAERRREQAEKVNKAAANKR